MGRRTNTWKRLVLYSTGANIHDDFSQLWLWQTYRDVIGPRQAGCSQGMIQSLTFAALISVEYNSHDVLLK